MSARDAWVTCRTQWKGIHRTVMTPGKYTELFFLDEATALAAGHRPCNDCRSARLGELPDGVFVQLSGEEGIARLRWRGRLHRWTAGGYATPVAVDESTVVTVLTPACTVQVLAAGYVPEVYPTAD